jgi:hypothetical protein
MFAPMMNFLRTSPYGPIIILLVALLVVLMFVVPIIRKIRRKSIKTRETKEIMKDLLTWRHMAQLVKGGDEHNKAKQELSDNIVRINELLKQGFEHSVKNIKNLYTIPWYIVLGEPRSGKSALLAASNLEMIPSSEENNPEEDPKNSLPVRMWTGAQAIVYDISGKVFFDRWLDGSSAEWNYIARQICRRRRRRALDGIIVTIPADALLADDDSLSSKKAILMANELGGLLQQSGMRLPCYVVITKLDMISGFQEYAKAFTGDLRNQILGFDNEVSVFSETAFKQFWGNLCDRLRSGSKQLIMPEAVSEGGATEKRMDMAGKIWLFPDNFSEIYKNLKIYLEILFGESNFHGTKNTFFEGVYFTSAKDVGFSFSPGIAALAERNTDDVIIPVVRSSQSVNANKADILGAGSHSTALVVVNATRTLLTPYLQRANAFNGYFIQNLLHRRVLVQSPHAELVKREAVRRHVPYYALCAVMIGIGLLWLSSAIFRVNELRVSLIQVESYYEWLDSILLKEMVFQSPLIKADDSPRFALDNDPVEGEALSSRIQFYYNTLTYRDMKTDPPIGFKLAEALAFRFDRNMGYRQKAFISNQLHKAMIRVPVIKNVGIKIRDQVDTQILDNETRRVIASFVSLDGVQGVDFYRYFNASQFELSAMIRYLIPDISNDTLGLLNSYKPKYDRSYTPQMDVDYIYSIDYEAAKQAALDTILSAWGRRAVYPDSIYGKIKSLAAISEEITVNYTDITHALNDINNVSTLMGVEEAVYGWKKITDRYKYLVVQGRSIFEEVRILLKAAHIPLGFEANLPSINLAGSSQAGGSSAGIIKRPVLDAFGNNLINDYLFNDLVISYAVREYTRLFDTDMEFLKHERGSDGSGALGQILSEQNTFSGGLNREVEELRGRARILQENDLLSQKLDEKPDSLSFFMAVERILTLASEIPIPQRDLFQNVSFETGWERNQNDIKAAMDAFEVYVKPYLENERLSVLIANARIMMLAEAYYNRYVVFTTSLSFLNTFEGNIAAIIESRSDNPDLFSFSGNAIEGLFGGFYYNKGYDPREVKLIVDNIASFASLFIPGEESKGLPKFLQNVDRRIYQPQPFMDYLASYISYWGNYPERVYVSAGTWDRFMVRSSEYKSFQINSVLLSIYTRSLEGVNQVDDSLLNGSLNNLKTRYTSSLNDSISLLSQFFSTDAERMFVSWSRLPADALDAYTFLRSLPEDELNNNYFTVYTPGSDVINIGWWNSFVVDGVSILARHADNAYMSQLIENIDRYKAYPLCGDAPYTNALSQGTMREIASLFESMGAGLPDQTGQGKGDPVYAALQHSLFGSSRIQDWARTVYQIAFAAVDEQKPLVWTAYQLPVEVQRRLPAGRRLLAIDRFRYIEVSSRGNAPQSNSTYMNERLNLLQGYPDDEAITLRFYKTSRDSTPGAVVTINSPWSIFELYLRRDRIADDMGNSYIPIYLEDEAGQYVYYLDVEFNVDIPKPSSWYIVRDWPDIMIEDGMITGKR